MPGGLSRGQPHSLSCTALPSAALSNPSGYSGAVSREQRRVMRDRQQLNASSVLLTQSIDDIKRLRDKARLIRNRRSSQLSTHFEETGFSEQGLSPLGTLQSLCGWPDREASSVLRRRVHTDLDTSLRSLPVCSSEVAAARRKVSRRPSKMLIRKSFEDAPETPIRRVPDGYGRRVLTSTPLDFGDVWYGEETAEQARAPGRANVCDEGPPRAERIGLAEGLRQIRELLERTERAMEEQADRRPVVEAAVQTDANGNRAEVGVQVDLAGDDGFVLGMRKQDYEGKVEASEPSSCPASTRATNSASVSLIHGEAVSPLAEVNSPPMEAQVATRGDKTGPMTDCFRGACELLSNWRGRRGR
ncbi:hypothetical protein FOZ61_002259 [Perkinsus olseni]|uniref:Uncharacterized protein n=1 Tax=Perkinsus olseni TaxID=32597 RepID=A0A7J6LTR0_PEROL|nr:hypothetical protein FOZ61_002259 [Perkinsus olseni]